ncbi:MAG: 30S ribosomal protein S20 [Patescibacteria group bacterium]|nr:30S ribosomal protein S20 [Patescibacteria group bacterium]
MPNKTSAKKALRQSTKREVANKIIKTNLKWLFKQGQILIKQGNKTEASQIAIKFQKAADKAVKHNVLSKNAANRKKGNLMNAVNKLSA